VFVDKAGKYQSRAPLGSLYGMPLALPTNIRLDWKGQLGTNPLAYYGHYTHLKKFFNIGLQDAYSHLKSYVLKKIFLKGFVNIYPG
jgi:hypothetical protein